MLVLELNHGTCKTYLLDCDEARRAALIDPLRERTERYLGVLAYHGYRLEYVIDTTPTPTTAPASSSWGSSPTRSG